jgi:PPOX class probable F420-dependent enzyme
MADTRNGPELHPDTVELGRGANYGSITTVLPSGRLQTQMIWVHTDGERLVVNTEVHRQKFKNVEQDSRVTLTIRDERDPYHYAEVRGRVVETVDGQRARDHILTQREPATGAIEAYETFDQRKPGWIKVELLPEAS